MSNVSHLVTFAITVLIALHCESALAIRPDSKPTRFYISVVDEDGEPVEGASIRASVFQEGSVLTGGMAKREVFQEISDSSSPMLVNSRTLGIVILIIEKDGYYTHHEQRTLQVGHDKGRYEPWNGTLRIALRHKVNPRPLYVHRVNWLAVPTFDEPIGFDLEKADWVAPAGSGVHADMSITLSRKHREGSIYRGEMEVVFPGAADGVIPIDREEDSNSALLLGREAPLDGYQPVYRRVVGVEEKSGVLTRIDDPTIGDLQDCDGIWFRVRSEVDEAKGLVKRARYGKIDGYVDFAARAKDEPPRIAFIYYLSPDDSRSLEWNGESLVENPYLQGITKF